MSDSGLQDGLWRLADVCSLTGLAASTIRDHLYPGARIPKTPIPRPVCYIGRIPLWDKTEIIAWNTTRDSSTKPRRPKEPTV